MNRIVRELGVQVQLRARPHGLRHAAITVVLDLSHGDVRAAARFSRHSDIRTLTVYGDTRQDLGGKMARLVAASL
jgi:integrase/recombinase XerC